MWFHIVPQVFYDIIGRFCPGLILITTSVIIFRGIQENFFSVANSLNNYPFAIYIVCIVMAYLIADFTHQVWRSIEYLLSLVKSSGRPTQLCPIDVLNIWQRMAQTTRKQGLDLKFPEDQVEEFAMLDYLRHKNPDDAIRLLKVRAESRFSASICVGFFFFAILCICLSDPFPKGSYLDQQVTGVVLVVLSVLSFFRCRDREEKLRLGLIMAFLMSAHQICTD
mgnify:CR=1 FL=1